MKKLICCLATLAVAFGALSAVTFVKASAAGTTPAFKGISVSLNENIVLKFEVENYTEGYTLTFNYKNKDYVGEVKGGVAEFAYVTPQYLDEVVTATIYDSEKKEVTHTAKSVKEYLYELIRAKKADYSKMPCEQFAAMKTLAVDMLNYGAAAQAKYLEKDSYTLVNADLTTEEAALATTFAAPGESVQATLSGTKAGYEWVSAGIRFDYNVSLYFVIKPLTENAVLKLKINDNEVIDKFTKDENGNYKFRYENVNVVDFATPYTVTVWDGETQIGQTLSYSVNTYVLNMHAKAEMSAITQAVYNYGVSAAKYNKAATSTAHLYDSLSLDGEAIAYVGEEFDLTTYALNKVCFVCGHKEAVDWQNVTYTAPDTTEKGEKKVTLTVGDLSTEITVKVYERIITPTDVIINCRWDWAGWQIEFDRQDLSTVTGYSSTKGYLSNDFVESIEYIICKDENTELGSIYLKKNGSNGYISDVNNTYGVSVNAIGNMYAVTNGDDIEQKWSNLVWLALRNDFETGATYKVKAKVIAKEGTYYADSEAYMTNSVFTTVEPNLAFNTTNLKNAKIVTEAPTDIEKDFLGYEHVGGVYLEQVDNRVNNVLTVRQEGSYYSTACMIVGDKVTFYVYSSTAGEAKIILNTASGNVGSYIDGTPNSVKEVILKNSFSVKFNGNDLTLSDDAKAQAYRQETGSWSVCQHFAETELATATVKKGWNAIQFVYEKGAQANLGDIRFEFVA